MMIRNENDIIGAFLQQCAELFDVLLVADVRATDGTAEALRSFSDPRLKIEIFEVNRQERYQGALMNLLSRRAFAAGADWVFLLDGDEFLGVQSRAELEAAVVGLGADVMMMPWINLVPTRFGSFGDFDTAQDFHWSGRTSHFSKIALSSLFATKNPDYYIQEGNHSVSPVFDAPSLLGEAGVPLLHLPVRSLDRLKYRIGRARRLVRAKHNRLVGEGTHTDTLDDLLSRGRITEAELRFLADSYGQEIGGVAALDPAALGWPVRRLPDFVANAAARPGPARELARGLSKALLADDAVTWDSTAFARGSIVAARIDGDLIRIIPQAISGAGSFRSQPFAMLGPAAVPENWPDDWLVSLVTATFTPIRAWAFSAWTELVPVMYALFTLLRPRRYVELGVHNGMSFFAACHVTERLETATECVAVDSWIGDEHAGIHDASVFDNFRAYLGATYPRQHYIQAYFEQALQCFEDGAIDLLHIDGLHTYEAVKQDFETWLPKMSEVGVIIFHDVNVYERGFGVWRLWEELTERYPAYAFAHQHGLGIIYVGRTPHPFATLLRGLRENRSQAALAQAYFVAVGTLLVEHRSTQATLDSTRSTLDSIQSTLDSTRAALAARPAVPPETLALLATTQQNYDQAVHQYNLIISSTIWRASAPVRAVFNRMPALRRLVRRTMKATWWTLTGQLPRRYREWNAAHHRLQGP